MNGVFILTSSPDKAAQACREAGRQTFGYTARGVSDAAGRGVPADLARVVQDDGRVSPLRAVSAVLARPGALADAVALRAGTAAAIKTVAVALARLQRTP